MLRGPLCPPGRLPRSAVCRTLIQASVLAFTLCAVVLPVRATIDMAVNTTNFVPGQASTLSVDGIITAGGTSVSITATHMTLRFDPAKLTLSNFRAGTGWSLLGTNTDDLSSGVFQAVLTNMTGDSPPGQTVTGPLLTFTGTPANADVDPNDCDTLKLDVSPGSTDMSDGNFEGTIPTDACGQSRPVRGGSGGRTPEAGTSTLPLPDQCQVDTAKRVLRIAGGLLPARCGDVEALDFDHDGKITLLDAVLALRTPCRPSGWYTFQSDRARSGRTTTHIELSQSEGNPLWYNDLALPAGFTPYHEDPADLPSLRPSPVVIPNPTAPCLRVIYAVDDGIEDATGTRFSFLFRVEEMPNGTPTVTSRRLFVDASAGLPFEAKGTPLVVNNRVYLTGNGFPNALEHTGFVLALDGTTLQPLPGWMQGTNWGRQLPGLMYGSAGWSPFGTQYVQDGAAQTHAGNCVLVASDGPYTFTGPDGYPVSSSTGFLYALDPDTGRHVWGHVSTNGDLVTANYGPLATPNHMFTVGDPPVPTVADDYSAGAGQAVFSGTSPGGLPPLAYPVVYSSPTTDNAVAYIADESCYVNARDITTGAFLWDNKRFYDTTQSCVSVAGDRLYYTGMGHNAVSMASGVSGGQVKWFLNSDPDYHEAGFEQVPANSDITSGWATPVPFPERDSVILNDIVGHTYSVQRYTPNPFNPVLNWDQTILSDYKWTFSSPLLAPGAAANTFAVFLTGDDRLIHVFDADSGDSVSPGTLADPKGVFGDGLLNAPVRSSMAAWNGRLYVLVPSPDTDLTDLAGTHPPARLLCYGQ